MRMKLDASRGRVNHRDMILFDELYDEEKYFGGIRSFDGVNYDDFRELLSSNLIDPEDAQNYAPTAGEIGEFLREHPNFTAHGYAVSPMRDDYRISFEGVSCELEYSKEDMLDFVNLFRLADEFTIEPGSLYCWFD